MHTLTNFKNFAEASLDLFQPLTILLGRNGSGKTNLIEGVELLSTLARGTPLNEITEIGRDGLFQVRGGLRSCLRFGANRIRLRFHNAGINFDGRHQSVDYLIEMTPSLRRPVCTQEWRRGATGDPPTHNEYGTTDSRGTV